MLDPNFACQLALPRCASTETQALARAAAHDAHRAHLDTFAMRARQRKAHGGPARKSAFLAASNAARDVYRTQHPRKKPRLSQHPAYQPGPVSAYELERIDNMKRNAAHLSLLKM
jgi:hypothetical protein